MAWLLRSLVWLTVTASLENVPRPCTVTEEVVSGRLVSVPALPAMVSVPDAWTGAPRLTMATSAMSPTAKEIRRAADDTGLRPQYLCPRGRPPSPRERRRRTPPGGARGP